MALKSVRSFILAMFILFAAAANGAAQSDRTSAIDAASRAIGVIRTAINQNNVDDADAVESQLRDMRDQGRLRLADIERELEISRTQIDLLGPAPGENDPPESDFIANERSTLEKQRAQLNGERTRVLANIYEAGELLTRLSGERVGALYRSFGERGASPLAPPQWSAAWSSASAVSERIGRYFNQWSARKSEGGTFSRGLLFIFGALIASVLMFWPVNRWISETFSNAVERRKPTPARRVVVAGLKMAARTAPGVIGGLVIIETLRAQGILAADGEAAARAFWIGVLSILIVSGFTAGFFSPSSPEWRIASIDAGRGRTVSRLAMAIAVFFSLKLLLTSIGVAAKADEALLRMIEASGALAIGACVILLSRKKLWRVEDKAPSGGWRVLRQSGRALAVIIIACALIGYVALADFLATRIVFLALVIGLAWLLQAMLAESALRLRAQLSGEPTSADEVESNNYKFWSRLIINSGLFLILTPAILILFGVPSATVRDLAGQALFGFNIGGVHIPSVAKFFAALVVFVVIMGLTKLVQRGVQRGPLAHSRADMGVQNSLITLLGYAGLVIALFASISALGVDLGNLALIAGALSVGIGFGLQSIVNNFVSGLILLFERPIKVGDWIVTNSGEGTVKKISVRSTEIETFDRSSIIVPNSELISSTVTNWTHKDKIGRFRLPVGVSYNSDPEQVREILLQCAKEHPLVVAYPEPFVVWNDFGASSLDFELRAFLNDISKGLQVRTDLRFTIFKALAEAGIEIPFPQTDVHIKSMPKEGSKPETDHA
ncbi:mechanosensitive ion channel family protein [Hyphococcus sp.]|uniref:mechanosensitive ion channel family protein n=1 Tax=Hyphococcus sp. TaxID=2038636 RepID=UPI00208D5685|nr:MAG: mechanosensitive ion channel protein [Marinicaulis sp.]